MSKYDRLREYVRDTGLATLKLTFEDIDRIAGVPIDHSFLRFKKELARYGYRVERISLKERTVLFAKLD